MKIELKQPDPNSNRSKKRKARGFVKTRHQKRAERRLAEKKAGRLKALSCCDAKFRLGYTEPGALKRW